jgi:hypothetical protein
MTGARRTPLSGRQSHNSILRQILAILGAHVLPEKPIFQDAGNDRRENITDESVEALHCRFAARFNEPSKKMQS